MELQVIRHAFALDFYRGFCPEDHAAALSYQLQRMFESGAAKEGDYFLVRDGKDPYLHVEIYRNNTRRIWEKSPVMCPKAAADKVKNAESLSLIYEFLKNDEYYFSPGDKLEIIVKPDNEFSNIMKKLNLEYGYQNIGSYTVFKLKIGKFPEIGLSENISLKSFTEIEPEERFKMVLENDVLNDLLIDTDQALFYQDFLDEGYFSEELWRIIYSGGELAGFIMPVFTSGLKNKISLANYHFFSGMDQDVSRSAVCEVCRIAETNGIRDLEFIVKDNDKELADLLASLNFSKAGSFTRYIQK